MTDQLREALKTLVNDASAYQATNGDHYLEESLRRARAALDAASAVDVERLAEVLSVEPLSWEVRRTDGAYVMTRMFDTPEEAAAWIVARLGDTR